MGNYDALKTAIQNAVDWDNNDKQISGNDMLAILLSIINNTVAAGYIFKGVAISTTNPGTPDQNVFYIAGFGTYLNFSSFIVPNGCIGVFMYNGSWKNELVNVANIGKISIPVDVSNTGFYTIPEVGNTWDGVVTENSNYCHQEIPCQEGDKFWTSWSKSSSVGGVTGFAILDANNVVLQRQYGASAYEITAPAGSVKAIYTTLISYANKKIEYKSVDCLENQLDKKLNISDIAQTTGSGTNVPMSQKAVTDLFTLDGAKISELQEKTFAKEIVYNIEHNFFTIGNYGDVVDITNRSTDNVGPHYSGILDVKEGDAFIFTGSTYNPAITPFAVLDKDNKIILVSNKATDYSTGFTYTNQIISVPRGGVKFIYQFSVDYAHKVLFSDADNTFAWVVRHNIEFGHYHIVKTVTAGPSSKVIIPLPGIITNNNRLRVVLNSASENHNFRFRHYFSDGTSVANTIFTTNNDITGQTWRPDGVELIATVLVNDYAATVQDDFIDFDVYTNVAIEINDIIKLNTDVPKKADKVVGAVNNHIATLDQYGNLKDSGYDVNNLPSSGLPSGGNDGDALFTDGNGHYYWDEIPEHVVTDASQLYGVLVDQYNSLNPGVSSNPAIARAIEVAGIGGTVIFSPNKTYYINEPIKPLKDQVFIGNGAIIKRMDESTTTVATAVPESSTNDVVLSSVPSDWKVDDMLFFYDAAAGQLGTYIAYAWINAINGNTITVRSKSTNPWALPVGTKVTKSVPMMTGSQYPTPVPFKVFNLVFDGNRDHNSGLLNWYIHGTINVFGFGSLISDCQFYNIPTENIVTQGGVVRNCFAQDLNGSFVHLSCPSEDLLNGNERYMGTFVIGNMCRRVCSVDNSILRHSQAPVTYSWNAGKLVVLGNQFYGTGNSMCLQMNMPVPSEPESPSETSNNGYMVYVSNIFNNFAKIGEIEGGTAYIYPNNRTRLIAENIFKDCGTNDMRRLYDVHIRFEDNLFEGNTVVNTAGNSEYYRVNTTWTTAPTAAQLTAAYSDLKSGSRVFVPSISKLYEKIVTENATQWFELTGTMIS